MARLVSMVDRHLSVSTLADTRGFGVMLLALLTGRRLTDSAEFGDNNNLVGWARQQHPRRRLADVFDPTLL
ncbi:hypothetical protein Taro_015187 [Colocasia esculenta]|uniref:Uncharacterized protein n=1 Tax=Colocasia esculenta TaxID=4460 RepID=A0A843USG0_COLES|nr:hypothetical protein [Colocasia esculenta]